jgi:hypothetical protein
MKLDTAASLASPPWRRLAREVCLPCRTLHRFSPPAFALRFPVYARPSFGGGGGVDRQTRGQTFRHVRDGFRRPHRIPLDAQISRSRHRRCHPEHTCVRRGACPAAAFRRARRAPSARCRSRRGRPDHRWWPASSTAPHRQSSSWCRAGFFPTASSAGAPPSSPA